MFAHPKSQSQRSTPKPRHDALVAKLLDRVIHSIKAKCGTISPHVIEQAREELTARVGANRNISDRDVKFLTQELIAAQNVGQGQRSAAVPQSTSADTLKESVPKPSSKPPTPVNEPPPAMSAPESVQRGGIDFTSIARGAPITRELLTNTTRKQREMLADAEWIQVAEEDRKNGIVGRINERNNFKQTKLNQKNALDEQIKEHKEQAERDRQYRIWMQQQMDETIAAHKKLTYEEKMAAFNKAMSEKKFREQQTNEMIQRREQQRTDEHNDQVRHMMMIRQEIERQRDEEAATKLRQKKEWQLVLQENAERLKEKEVLKDLERQEDRRYQKEYEDNLDRQDRLRAEHRARKEARQQFFQGLHAKAAQATQLKKEEDLTKKIESEYEAQLQRSLEDEENRKKLNKQRLIETHNVLDRQIANKKNLEAMEKEQARQLAEALREQAREAQFQDQCRRQAMKQESNRMREFLNTQLQLQHFKESRPLETSIARPASRAKTMYTPSLYSPSPKL